MKRRKNAILLLVVCLMAVCLSACGSSSNSNQEKTSSSEETGNSSVLQIQNLQGIVLDENPKLPYQIKMYTNSRDAFNNPTVINLQECEYVNAIWFSFTSENEAINSVENGVIIEENRTVEGAESYRVNEIGEIQTFSLVISDVEEVSTAVYSIYMRDSYDYYYIAFRIIPKPTTATTTTAK